MVDNKDGTEQLNGVQVKPFNKLSDTIGGRNLATSLGDVLITALNSGWSNTLIGTATPEFFKIINQGTTQPITISFEINTPDDPTKTHLFDRIEIDGCAWGKDNAIGTNYFSIIGFKWLEIGNSVWKGTYTLQYDQGSGVIVNDGPDINLFQTGVNKAPHNFTVLGNSLCLYWGTQAIDWTPAPEDKVNVSDMRKPASDVAGIEEVNAKQDKIGYTPADDSKVVHDNHDGTITANNLHYDLSKTGLTPIGFYNSGSFNDLPLGTVMTAATKMTDGPDRVHNFTTTTFYFNSWGNVRKAQIAIADSENLMYFRVYTGVSWNSWTLLSDDSKVAHLSGANNFDTVPTVNNNPLLLASSLPADLARTRQAQTFTAQQTFSIAPVINDASKDKGDNQAATMADLKSVENSAWHQLNNVPLGGIFLYRIDRSSKRIYISYSVDSDVCIKSGTTIANFSSIVNSILTISGSYFQYDLNDLDDPTTSAFYSSVTKLSLSSPAQITAGGNVLSHTDVHASLTDKAYFTYDSLVN
ncbi:hypothetical protein [Lentilactobacillus diolivorans]|uniref:hypothetical protein n=1 Tax=Lentilactobacillus diolivorans TaxID=179838 RepID=UPI003CC8365A